MITDVESNFTIEDQKINTDNLRLKGPTIVLLGKGWVNFDQICDLNMTVDLSSGVVPAIAHDVLNTLNIHIYDKISNPKFKRKISVPQVINTLLKNLLASRGPMTSKSKRNFFRALARWEILAFKRRRAVGQKFYCSV